MDFLQIACREGKNRKKGGGEPNPAVKMNEKLS
jgi:hypothetical protein